jgi:hypothetical protein
MSPLITCTSHHPEVVFGVLVEILHLDIVPGSLRFASERQVPLVFPLCVAGAILRPTCRLWPLKAVPSSQVRIHRVPFGDARRGLPRKRRHCINLQHRTFN